MIVNLTADGNASLLEAGDFKRLKIIVPPGPSLPVNERISFINADQALISRDLIPHLATEADTGGATAAWLDRYEAMIAAAARHGWIDETTQWIKVHIER